MTDWKKQFTDLVANKPIYSKVKINKGIAPSDIYGNKIKLECENCQSEQTFVFEIGKPVQDSWVQNNLNKTGFDLNFSENPSVNAWEHNFYFHPIAKCMFCNNEKYYYLLKLIQSNEESEDGKSFWTSTEVQKIGQFPPFQFKPDKTVLRFLTDEDKENYSKAKMCLSQSYGIGAFSYYRRILEKEIVRIIEDLASLETDNSEEIKALYEKYKKDHQMSNMIDGIKPFLPDSLKSIGENPIKLLYKQLSGGIHDFSEEDCLEKSLSIDSILCFILKKLEEEKSDLKDIRKAMKKLKGD